MDQGAMDVTEAANKLSGDVWARALISGTADRWTLRHLRAVAGTEPAAWPEQDWIYADVGLVRGILPAQSLQAVLATETEKLTFGGVEVEVPALQAQVSWHRRSSFEQHDRERLKVPTFDLQVSAAQPNQHQLSSSGYLVGRDCPSFPDVQYAYRAFFEGNFSLDAGMSLPNELMNVRIVNREGWIGPIRVSPIRIDVDICGDALKGSSLEYFSSDERRTKPVDAPGTVSFPLPDGLPENSVWLWLKRDGDWLDYRALYRPWATPDQLTAAGVHIEPPVDPLSTVEALIAGGEGPHVEFKRSLPDTDSKSRNPYKTVAAFASGDGGTIVFGIDRDEMTVAGLEVADINVERDRLANLIRSRVNPTPPFEATPYIIDNRQILLLRVDPGPIPPYGIVVDPNFKDRPEYFVRRGASTYHAWPADLHESMASRQQQAPYPGGIGGFMAGGAYPA